MSAYREKLRIDRRTEGLTENGDFIEPSVYRIQYSKLANYTEEVLQKCYEGINYWINLSLGYIFILLFTSLFESNFKQSILRKYTIYYSFSNSSLKKTFLGQITSV